MTVQEAQRSRERALGTIFAGLSFLNPLLMAAIHVG
jgi:hypothetical protein